LHTQSADGFDPNSWAAVYRGAARYRSFTAKSGQRATRCFINPLVCALVYLHPGGIFALWSDDPPDVMVMVTHSPSARTSLRF
jgi:hypothetical protein